MIKYIFSLVFVAIISFSGCYGLLRSFERTNSELEAAGYVTTELKKKDKRIFFFVSLGVAALLYVCSALNWILGTIVSAIFIIALAVIQWIIPEVSITLTKGIGKYSFQFAIPFVLSLIWGQTKSFSWGGIKKVLVISIIGILVVPLCGLIRRIIVNHFGRDDSEEEADPTAEPASETEPTAEPASEPERDGEPEPASEAEPEGEPEFEDEDDESEFEEGEPRRRINWWTVAFVATLVVAAIVVYFVVLK